MKILNEDVQNNRFDQKFIKALEDQGYDLEKVIERLTSEVTLDSDKYPNISAATEYSSNVDNEVSALVTDILVDMQDTVLAEDTDNYDIIDIIADIFWDNTGLIDEYEYKNNWASERAREDLEDERQDMENDYWNSRI